jgi:hypothetical protein
MPGAVSSCCVLRPCGESRGTAFLDEHDDDARRHQDDSAIIANAPKQHTPVDLLILIYLVIFELRAHVACSAPFSRLVGSVFQADAPPGATLVAPHWPSRRWRRRVRPRVQAPARWFWTSQVKSRHRICLFQQRKQARHQMARLSCSRFAAP